MTNMLVELGLRRERNVYSHDYNNDYYFRKEKHKWTPAPASKHAIYEMKTNF